MTATMQPFKPSRLTGKSDGAIICELASGMDPGTVIRHEAIAEALQQDTDRHITHSVACAAARRASKMLLKRDQRCLVTVPGVGYRVSHGSDHHGLALSRYDRADVQLRHGISVLQYVRREEMTQNQQLAHDGTLIVMSSLVQMTKATKARQDKIEEIIGRIAGKVGVSLDGD